jgi:guanylate kinase
MADIETLISEYTPNEAGVELLRQTELVLLVGITGAGKNTVLNEMVKSGEYHDLITTITREPRYNNGVLEQDGVEYYFVSQERALELLKAGEYVEVSPVHGRIYGVTVDEVRKAHDAGVMAIADIDVQGVSKYKKLSDNVSAIFLVPPSYEEWQRRVRLRYPTEEEFLEDWPNRRASAVMELEKALTAPYYHFVVNDDLTLAVDACMKIAKNRDRFVRKDDETRLLARDLLDTIISEVNRTTRS